MFESPGELSSEDVGIGILPLCDASPASWSLVAAVVVDNVLYLSCFCLFKWSTRMSTSCSNCTFSAGCPEWVNTFGSIVRSCGYCERVFGFSRKVCAMLRASLMTNSVSVNNSLCN